MPPEVSPVRVRIGRRLLVRSTSPIRGTRCRLCARVCSFDMNSARSARLNAQVSTTCSPWVLITVIVLTGGNKGGLAAPCRDFDKQFCMPTPYVRTAIMSISTMPPHRIRHADRGPGRTYIGGKIARIDFIHLWRSRVSGSSGRYARRPHRPTQDRNPRARGSDYPSPCASAILCRAGSADHRHPGRWRSCPVTNTNAPASTAWL